MFCMEHSSFARFASYHRDEIIEITHPDVGMRTPTVLEGLTASLKEGCDEGIIPPARLPS